MNMFDKLFSREIQRRTGAHAVSIYIETAQKRRRRSRAIGAGALKTANTTVRRAQRPLFQRLNIRFPWLKFVFVAVIILLAVADLLNLTISRSGDTGQKISIAPMSHHPKATSRDIKDKKLVALTFDDGPSAETTPKLLELLTEKDLPATFFMLGSRAQSNPDLVKRVAKNHHEVASHTMHHQNLVRIPDEAAVSDINEAKSVFRDILGQDPLYTRPPYGNINNTVRSAATTPLILWSVDTEDWRSKDTNTIIATTLSEVYDGAIILMHDIYPTSVAAVPELVDTLRREGYEFVTISELAKARNITLNPGEVYYGLRP